MGSVQLMQDSHIWWVVIDRSAVNGPQWRLIRVGVSIIEFDTSTANRFAAFYEPEESNVDNVERMWEFLLDRASTYPFAEQTVGNNTFNGHFQNWPNSRYSLLPGNNSNSFARWMVTQAGMDIPNLRGSFPGRHLPVQVSLGSQYRNMTPVREQDISNYLMNDYIENELP